MKNLMFILFVLITCSLYSQEFCVATYNVRNQNSWDSINGNAWSQRCPYICEQINFEQPAVFGSQEVLHGQLMDMLKLLKDYDYIGVGRDDGVQGGEYSPILYNTNKVEKLDGGWFWLNTAPDKPIKGWDAACIRICTWGRFKDKLTGRIFCFFTLHMDHVGVIARRESALLIVEKVKEIAKNDPAIVTGDFNVDQNNEIYSIFTNSGILNDSYDVARQKFAPNGTFNSFDPSLKTLSRIDHIFVSPTIEILNYAIMTNTYWTCTNTAMDKQGNDAPIEISLNNCQQRCPSDHWPVFVRLKL